MYVFLPFLLMDMDDFVLGYNSKFRFEWPILAKPSWMRGRGLTISNLRWADAGFMGEEFQMEQSEDHAASEGWVHRRQKYISICLHQAKPTTATHIVS